MEKMSLEIEDREFTVVDKRLMPGSKKGFQ